MWLPHFPSLPLPLLPQDTPYSKLDICSKNTIFATAKGCSPTVHWLMFHTESSVLAEHLQKISSLTGKYKSAVGHSILQTYTTWYLFQSSNIESGVQERSSKQKSLCNKQFLKKGGGVVPLNPNALFGVKLSSQATQRCASFYLHQIQNPRDTGMVCYILSSLVKLWEHWCTVNIVALWAPLVMQWSQKSLALHAWYQCEQFDTCISLTKSK